MAPNSTVLHRLSSVPRLSVYYFLSPRFTSTSLSRLHDLPYQQTEDIPPPLPSLSSFPLKTFANILKTALQHPQKPLGFYFHLVKSCSQYTHLLQILAVLIRTHLIQHHSLSVNFMSKAAHFVWRNPDHLRRIFSQFSEPSVSHYGAMIRACSDSDCPREGIEFFGKMQRDGLLPDAVASSFCLKCCAVIRSLVGGVQVHSRILVGGHQFDSRLMATLMDVYSVCEKCDDACKVFVDITHKDTVVWNVLISCLLNNCRTRDALEVFDIMQRRQHRCKPDVVTCLWLLQGCGTLGDLDFGKRIHSFIDERGYGNAINLGNALISMYSKCGRMDEAYKVFDKMPRKTVVSWTALIFGLAINGYGRDAIDVFWEMLSVGILPDAHTFTGVLSACSRSGLVDEGIQFFEQMTRDFGIVPNIHHYGCMVDLLGRAGLLNQAYELIVSMRIKPDPTIWRILLGACRIYKQAPLGEHVIPQLVELKAQESGDYILLLSVYSSRGDTEKVTLLRKYMMENGIQAMPGCSTIELKGVVHEFVADDSSHPQKDEIYNELIDIGQQLKIAGYVPETLQELDNQNEAEKGAMLSYHSEKLAIAFAVLATPPSTTIRVAKNPKICVDCHNFAKLFSSVYDRKVIIWDHSRVHHFREGCCSCDDCW